MDDDGRRAEQRARVEGPQGPEARSRAVWRLSPLVPRDLGWLFGAAQPIGVVLIFIVLSGLLYLRYFANGGHAVEGGGRMGGSFVFDPQKDGYGLFYLFVATMLVVLGGLVWAFLAKRAGQRWYADERAYADELPFSVFGYPAVVGEHESEYQIDIYFVAEEPDSEKLVGLLMGIDGLIKHKDPDRKHGADGWHFIAVYPKGEASGSNAQRFVGAVRAITGGLVAMHAQYPIDRMELTGSSSERFNTAMAEWRRSD